MKLISTTEIKLKKSTHFLLEPGLVRMNGKEGEYIELEDAIEMREANLKLSQGKPFCLLMSDLSGYYTFSPDARRLLASREYYELRKAVAFVVNSLATKLISQAFIRMNKPKSPTKIFSNERDALEWLREMNAN